jgi:hypothetical protein
METSVDVAAQGSLRTCFMTFFVSQPQNFNSLCLVVDPKNKEMKKDCLLVLASLFDVEDRGT